MECSRPNRLSYHREGVNDPINSDMTISELKDLACLLTGRTSGLGNTQSGMKRQVFSHPKLLRLKPVLSNIRNLFTKRYLKKKRFTKRPASG